MITEDQQQFASEEDNAVVIGGVDQIISNLDGTIVYCCTDTTITIVIA
jgi:hypothetical protein